MYYDEREHSTLHFELLGRLRLGAIWEEHQLLGSQRGFSDALFDAVAQGRLLILSPFPYNPDKRDITRPECVALNGFAEEICASK